jgi:two-component system, NarL family, sensor kinase
LSSSGLSPAESESRASRPAARSFWSDAYGPLPIEVRSREPGLVLIQLETHLLERLTRLVRLEARLWKAAADRRSRTGRRAVRQIERERKRLGRELHTGVGQLLAAIRIQLEVVSVELPSPPAPVSRALQRIGSLASEALEQVRGVSRRLYPPSWQRLGLDEAIRELWESSGMAQRFAGSVVARPLPRDPDPEVKTMIYRAAQEALSNIVRHAHATRVDVGLAYAQGQLRLTVQDDGVGFDVARVLTGRNGAAAGIGLQSLREEAADLGGKLLVESSPLGTTLEITVALET